MLDGYALYVYYGGWLAQDSRCCGDVWIPNSGILLMEGILRDFVTTDLEAFWLGSSRRSVRTNREIENARRTGRFTSVPFHTPTFFLLASSGP